MPSHKKQYPAIQRLAGEIKENYANFGSRAGTQHAFLPRNKLNALVTRDSVRTAFQEARIHHDYLEDYVLRGDARRLFLILVSMSTLREEKLSLLPDLEEAGITDATLPLRYNESEDKVYCDMGELTSLKEWGNDMVLFTLRQWRFISPVFTRDKFIHTIEQERIMPYREIPTHPTSSGYFGDVTRFYIHRAHIPALETSGDDILDGEWIPVAIKKVKDAWNSEFFSIEADNLHKLLRYNSPYLIEPIAAFEHGDSKCFMFPWAAGGNLGELWRNHEGKRADPASRIWLVEQLVGIFSALKKLHGGNFRHGDLKPENILWFKGKHDQGVLKIADLGLAKPHETTQTTKMRNDNGVGTRTPSGTSRYEPPEMDRDRGRGTARSRQYDIWSMGCVILELLIWLMYGMEAVRTFRAHTPYFWSKIERRGLVYEVHPYVVACMGSLKRQLRERLQGREAAHGALLSLVQERLLVVQVSEDYTSHPECREIAKVLHRSLEAVYAKCCRHKSYLPALHLPYPESSIERNISHYTPVWESNGRLDVPDRAGNSRPLGMPVPGGGYADGSTPMTDGAFLNGLAVPTVSLSRDNETIPHNFVNNDSMESQASSGLQSTMNQLTMSDKQEQAMKLNDNWESNPNDEFASHLFGLISWDHVRPSVWEKGVVLCPRCGTTPIGVLFEGHCNLSELQSRAVVCDLCRLLQDAFARRGYKAPQIVSLSRKGGVVSVENGPRLLSIYSSPDSTARSEAPLGLPRLLEPASADQFTLLGEWLRVCDAEHDQCALRRHSGASDGTETRPTRLIDLGEPLRLVDTASRGPSVSYVALSHCWGALSETERFCTYTRNVAQLRESIDWDPLPRTFRDAITVARGIGARYLWIDSLCIVQDDTQDWENESAKMGQIFHAAYCTLCATSAKSSLDGFLHSRRPRPCVAIETKSASTGSVAGTLYVCPNIDDFERDVDLGELNTRGWVLQERVLSRRCIFFTSTQVYWSCGGGVQSETLARLWNAKAAFLGDPQFPNSALEYYRDGRQMLVQDLYERYSGLAFSHSRDRPVAILGLQERLSVAFKTHAAYGFLAPYFARLLLWKRSGVQRMVRIVQPRGSRQYPPSWSWFSKMGAIKYMDLKFQEIDWAVADFQNPFKTPSMIQTATMRGRARRLVMTPQDMLVSITFDEEAEFDVADLRCMVVGRDKNTSWSGSIKHHVLIIRQVGGSTGGADIYERVGVASLHPSQVAEESWWVTIR